LRQKRISESSSQQLLLDTYNIKTVLLALHSLEAPTGNNGEGAVATYNRNDIDTHVDIVHSLSLAIPHNLTHSFPPPYLSISIILILTLILPHLKAYTQKHTHSLFLSI
jgi:hypothetical protein